MNNYAACADSGLGSNGQSATVSGSMPYEIVFDDNNDAFVVDEGACTDQSIFQLDRLSGYNEVNNAIFSDYTSVYVDVKVDRNNNIWVLDIDQDALVPGSGPFCSGEEASVPQILCFDSSNNYAACPNTPIRDNDPLVAGAFN
jgi:hypothetical protein